MNTLINLLLGLLFIIPTTCNSVTKHKIKSATKIIIGTASALSASIILRNIAATAQRRLANPDYTGSKSFSALLGQMGTILIHNKSLAAMVMSMLGVSGALLYSATQDLKTDAQLINK